MSNCFPVRCMRCGQLISHKYDAYCYLRNIYLKNKDSHIDVSYLDYETDETTIELYKIFRLDKECCKVHFLTTVLPKDLESMNFD